MQVLTFFLGFYIYPFFFFNFYSFIYLVALDLGCNMWDLSSQTRD